MKESQGKTAKERKPRKENPGKKAQERKQSRESKEAQGAFRYKCAI